MPSLIETGIRRRGDLRRFAIAAAPLILLACRLAVPAPVEPPPTVTVSPAIPTPTEFPTETPLPTSTPAPTASPDGEPRILFKESFEDQTTCFRLHSFEPGVELGIQDGAYHVRVEGDSAIDLPCMGGYDDFALFYDFRFTEAGEESLVGFTYRSYVGTAYNIYLSGLAEFCWDHADFNAEEFRILAGCWTQLPDYVASGETIRISVIAAQERMAVLIDGFLLAAVSDPANDYGSFGFFVLNNGPGATEIVLDNILIRELVDDDLEYFRDDQTGY